MSPTPILAFVLATAWAPALAADVGPSSQPAEDALTELGVIDQAIVFDDERERLTREYRAARYGQIGVTSRIAPHGMVIHLTGEPTLEASLALYRSSRVDARTHPRLAERSALGPSVHLLIDVAGKIHQLLPLATMARHAGPLNTTSIGVALVGARQVDITSSQRAATRELSRSLLFDTATPFIIGHHDLERLRGSPYWRDPADAKLARAKDPGTRLMEGLTAGVDDLEGRQIGTDFLYDRAWLEQRSLAELILLRNGVFARWGRPFPSRPWVQKHFDEQPGYVLDTGFEASVLTLLDNENVRLIADVERRFTVAQLKARRSRMTGRLERDLLDERIKRNGILAQLFAWQPGSRLERRAINAIDRDTLFEFYVRMTMTLGLSEISADCFDVAGRTGIDGVCAAWEQAEVTRSELSQADKRTLRHVERRLAYFVIEQRYAGQDELGDCLVDCTQPWGEPGPDGAEVERPPTSAEQRACKAECREELSELARVLDQDKRADLRDLTKGLHASGGDLINQLLYGDLDGFG